MKHIENTDEVCVHFNKKYYCFNMLAEVEHNIPCIFDECRSVWKSLQVLSAQIHTVLFPLLKLLEFCGNETSKTKCWLEKLCTFVTK